MSHPLFFGEGLVFYSLGLHDESYKNVTMTTQPKMQWSTPCLASWHVIFRATHRRAGDAGAVHMHIQQN